jgi:hypothetical protein
MLSLPRVKSLRSRREMSIALRVLTALMVWLSVGGHVSGLAHFALVSHHVCATHGELEHGDDHAHAPAASTHALPEDSTGGAPSLGAPVPVEDEHGDCSVLARQKDEAVLGADTAPALAPALSAEAKARRLDVMPFRTAAALAFAPKTSPPV